MHNYTFTLANDTDGIGKIVVFVIVAIIYGIGALASMVKKANEAAKRRAATRPALPTAQPQQYAPAMPVRRATPPPLKRALPPARRVQKDAFAQSAAQRAAALKQMAARSASAAPQVVQQRPHAAPQQPAPAPAQRPVVAPTRAAAPIANAAATLRPGGANAATIRRWLRPDTMRKQFILTELLQPAMALREPRSKCRVQNAECRMQNEE